MRVIKTFKPNKPGAKRFYKQYKEQLVAVRYRQHQNTIYTTIELVIEQRPAYSTPEHYLNHKILNVNDDDYLPIKVSFDETELRYAIKSNGGKWQTEDKVWALPYGLIKVMGLSNRVQQHLMPKYSQMDFYN